jgi:thiol-disulfide isomerase/thioredoxin
MAWLLTYFFYLIILYLVMFAWRPARGQNLAAKDSLKIGDRVPDVVIDNILRYKTPQAKLSDFEGKLLILDFWATWCKPCVEMIPRADSLEKQFAGKVVFLPVTYQRAGEVAAFRDKYARRKALRIHTPEVVSDTALARLFPHHALPHYVWIAPDRTLAAVTNWDQVTADNIRRLLDGQQAGLEVKADEKLLGYDAQRSSLSDFASTHADAFRQNSRSRSIYTGYIPGLSGQVTLKRPQDPAGDWRVTFTNITPFHLYSMAYGEGKYFRTSHSVDLQTRDSLTFISGLQGSALREWIPRNTLCYELVLPARRAGEAFDVLKQELDKMFPAYQASIQTRTRTVLALVRTSDQEKFKSRSGQFSEKYENYTYQLRRSSMEVFVMGLDNGFMRGSSLPLVDMTGYQGLIDLDLDVDFNDLASVRKALAGYNLALQEKQVPIRMLVIGDRKTQVTPAE